MSSDKILSVCAIIISVIALFVSIWQGVVTREHNKLSVKPNFLVAPILQGKGGKNGIYLSNAGLGPGIISEAKLVINDEEFDLKKNSWPEVLKKINIKPICFSTSWLPAGSALKSSKEVPLISITRGDLGACYIEVMKLIVNNDLKIKINYSSMYGEQDVILTNVSMEKDDFNFSKMLGVSFQ